MALGPRLGTVRNALSARVRDFGTTIFTEITELAIAHDATNLGQGFPDTDGPEFVKRAAIEAITAGQNQYARGSGVPPLTEAIAQHQRRYYDLSYDPLTEVTVTSGATEAIFATLQGICDPGDEVIVFEPLYDSYAASITMAGGKPVAIPLEGADMHYDLTRVAKAIGERTRAIILNSPHNPTGKVFNNNELQEIADLCRKHDLIVVSDEVYEHLVYDGAHVPMATLEGMRERTITISSAGKTFSLTGWKIGWACAPPELTAAVRRAHQFITFATATPLQHAVAAAFSSDESEGYLGELSNEYRDRRDLLCAGLDRAGFRVLKPAGGYFAFADIRPLGFDDADAFCRALPRDVGVAAVPAPALYLEPELGRHYVRFAFCKTRSVLEEAVTRITNNLGKLSP